MPDVTNARAKPKKCLFWRHQWYTDSWGHFSAQRCNRCDCYRDSQAGADLDRYRELFDLEVAAGYDYLEASYRANYKFYTGMDILEDSTDDLDSNY